MAQQNFVMECGLSVTVYELLLWLSSFVMDCWNDGVYELGLFNTTCTIFKFDG